MFHLHRWNVVYDLGDGSGFYEESGFRDYCGDKLNPNWFMLSASSQAEEGGSHSVELQSVERDEYVEGHMVHSVNSFTAETTFGAMVFLVVSFAVIALWRRCGSTLLHKEGTLRNGERVYGAM